MKARYLHYRIGEALARLLPEPAGRAVAALAGRLYARALSPDVDALRENLRFALPPDTPPRDVLAAARALIRQYALYLGDLQYAERLHTGRIRHEVEFHGRERLDRALAAGHGAILVSAHVGNWELAAMALARLGYPIHGIALPHRDPRVERLFERRRRAHGLRILHVGQRPRRYYEILKRGEVLAMNADRVFVGEGLPVRFLGCDVHFPAGPERLAALAGSPVLPAFCVRTGPAHFRYEIQEPLAPSGTGAMTQEFARRVEGIIRAYPTQWFVFQRFWEKPEWPD